MMDKHIEQYDKKQLFEAFQAEYNTRKKLEGDLKKERMLSAKYLYERDRYMEDWLRLHIQENVTVEGDMNEALDEYFTHTHRKVYFTPSGGYYCIIQQEECLFIVFAWHNPNKWRQEIKDMPELIKNIYYYAQQPIRYVGINNVIKNHSKDLGDGLFELRL